MSDKKQKEIQGHAPGWEKSKRYRPPNVNNDFNAEWHAKGVCNYLETIQEPQSLADRLIGMIKKAGKLFSFLGL